MPMTDAEYEAMTERAAAAEYEADSNILWSEASALTKDAYREGMRAALTAIGAREMVDALEKGAGWFDEYATLHRAKAPPDEDKAQRNAERAAELRGALAKARGGQ